MDILNIIFWAFAAVVVLFIAWTWISMLLPDRPQRRPAATSNAGMFGAERGVSSDPMTAIPFGTGDVTAGDTGGGDVGDTGGGDSGGSDSGGGYESGGGSGGGW